jgi:tetratricopeptide (TPR) repeat protein
MSGMKLKLKRVTSNGWKFEHPLIVTRFNKMFNEAIALMNEGYFDKSEYLLRVIIEESPEHIDAYHHLALLLVNKVNVKEAFRLWMKAVGIGKRCFPIKDFIFGKDLLEWDYPDNRPFLSASESLGLLLYNMGEVEEALKIFHNILSINPNDDQGIRSLAIQAHFDLNQPEEVLRICDNYRRDIMADTLYGRPLALIQTGKKDQAERHLKEAIQLLPLIAKELTKKRHIPPEDLLKAGNITIGGPDKAYDYWQRFGKVWKDTEGAIDFMKGLM